MSYSCLGTTLAFSGEVLESKEFHSFFLHAQTVGVCTRVRVPVSIRTLAVSSNYHWCLIYA